MSLYRAGIPGLALLTIVQIAKTGAQTIPSRAGHDITI
jgi:hypothetical protein